MFALVGWVSRTDDEHPAGRRGRCGAYLLHRGWGFICLGELAVVFEAALEFGVDMCHGCGFGRDMFVRLDGVVGWWEKVCMTGLESILYSSSGNEGSERTGVHV